MNHARLVCNCTVTPDRTACPLAIYDPAHPDARDACPCLCHHVAAIAALTAGWPSPKEPQP